MDTGLVRVIVAIAIAAHGVGHVIGWLPALGIARFEGASSRSWLLGGILGDGPATLMAGAVFLVPTAGFVAAAAGLLTGQPWWRQVAVASASISLAGSALYPTAFPTGSTVGSVAVNVAVLTGILVIGWGAQPAGA